MSYFMQIVFIFFLTGIARSNVITVVIPIEDVTCSLNSEVYGNVVIVDGVPSISRIGSPSLPEVPMKVALPAGCRAISLEILSISYGSIGKVEFVAPVSRQVPTSGEWPFRPTIADPDVYERDNFYPDQPVLLSGSGVIWGIPIASLQLHPARWNPVSGELEYLESLTLSIETEFSMDVSTISRRTLESETRSIEVVKKLVVNPEDVSGSGAYIVEPRDLEYGQYVIICPAEYSNEFQVLADWKTSKGIPSTVYSTDWIESNYSCYDQQQEIRAFLTDCRTQGTDYALLGGDDDVLPARRVLLSGVMYSRPSDLYFIDINDTFPGQDNWDSNHNHIWGESDDIIDWHPDIWTGRASVNSEVEAELFVNKVLFYEHVLTSWNTSPACRAPVEMRIGYSTGALYMGLSDTIWGSSATELVSTLIPPAWQQEKLYESEGNNSTPLTIEMINMGMNHVFHVSHGEYWEMCTAFGDIMDSTQVSNLENISSGGTVTILSSNACMVGAFDSLTCIADSWLNSANGGGFGSFNTNNGYFGFSGTPGSSSKVTERFFYEYLINDFFNHGMAHSLAIDFFSPPPWNSSMEEVSKVYTLFGDPELPMWTEEPENLSVIYPASINGNTTVNVTVTSQGVPLNNARVCIQKGNWQTGEVYDTAVTDASGLAQLCATPQTTEPIGITVWAHNHNLFTGKIEVLETAIGVVEEIYQTAIESVFPVPVSNSATISWSSSCEGPARLTIFDLQGRCVKTLENSNLATGNYTTTWDVGSTITSGVYFVRLNTGALCDSRSIVVLR